MDGNLPSDEPQRGITQIIYDRITIVFLGVLVSVCMLEFVLFLLALSALRTVKWIPAIDPDSYTVVTVAAAILGMVATLSFIMFFVKSGKSR